MAPASTELKAPAENTTLRTKTKRVERLGDRQIRELVAAYEQVQQRNGWRAFAALQLAEYIAALPSRQEVRMPDGVMDDAEPTPAERKNLVLSALDTALRVHGSMVEKNIARARQRHPDATPTQVIRALERMYRSALTGTGAAVGAVAAVPAVGTGTALALSGGEAFTTLELTALFAFSLAQIHGFRLTRSSAAGPSSWG